MWQSNHILQKDSALYCHSATHGPFVLCLCFSLYFPNSVYLASGWERKTRNAWRRFLCFRPRSGSGYLGLHSIARNLDTWPQLTSWCGPAMCPEEKRSNGICKHQKSLQQMSPSHLFIDVLGTTLLCWTLSLTPNLFSKWIQWFLWWWILMEKI